MEYNLFANIFKFKESEYLSQLENYCTEIFVYIFKKSIEDRTIVAFELLKLFGIKCQKELPKKITISTRNQYTVNDKIVIPDIEIKYNEKRIFIEVKINSGLNWRKIKRKTIDQLEMYTKIDNINNVYSLTKYLNDSSSIDNNHKILWSQICEIIEFDEVEINKNFLSFLKENGMEKNLPIGNNVLSALQEARNLWYLIWNSWPNEIPDFELAKDDFTADYIGYIVKYKKNSVIWIGQTLEVDGSIIIELTDDKYIKKLKKNDVKIPDEKDEAGNIIFSKLDMKKILNEKTEAKQRRILGNWIRENLEKLL